MLSVLILGLLLGLQHATEADHLAAVASLTTRGTSLRDAARQGAAWGVGHGLTLLLFGGAVLLIDGIAGPQVSLLLEAAEKVELTIGNIDAVGVEVNGFPFTFDDVPGTKVRTQRIDLETVAALTAAAGDRGGA